jgi:uncharacterized beta-barrel protein YwiB (DUF1934 family)
MNLWAILSNGERCRVVKISDDGDVHVLREGVIMRSRFLRDPHVVKYTDQPPKQERKPKR